MLKSTLVRWTGLSLLILAAAAIDAPAQEREEGQDGARRQRQGQGQRRGGFQGRGGFGGRGGGGVTMSALLGAEKVQTELKLSDEQKEKIKTAADEARTQGRELFSGLQGLRDKSEEERTKAFAEMREKGAEMRKEADAKAVAVLDDAQKKRLQGIYIQVAGVRSLSDEAIAKELEINELQAEEIKLALEDSRKKAGEQQREMFGKLRDGSLTREDYGKKMEELRGAGDKDVLAVLSEDQRKEYEALQGEKVEITQRDLFTGRGGFGNRGGQRGRRPGGDGEEGGRRRRPGGEGEGEEGGGRRRPQRPAESDEEI